MGPGAKDAKPKARRCRKRLARASDPAAATTVGLQDTSKTCGRSLWLGRETGHSAGGDRRKAESL
jgi:hypothetical protein